MGGTAANNMGPLGDGSTVAIVGGGPAGSSCAIMLRRLAARKGIALRVLLFEYKDFAFQRNVCVGVLSPPFQTLLGELDLTLPRSIVQRHIKGYTLHSKRQTVFLEEKPGTAGQTMVADRTDLDTFLLESVRQAGGMVVDEAVVDIRFDPDKVLLVGRRGTTVEADVVVGAFGLDEDALSLFEARVPGFRRPSLVKSILTEIPVAREALDARLDGTIHAVLIDHLPRVDFGALTPRRDYVTANIAGQGVTDDDLDAFLQLPSSRALIPEATAQEQRYYHAFPSSPARTIYGDRFVTVGNASGLLRPLKGKGINTGLITGMEAARTMIDVGISKQAFDEYCRRCHVLTSEFSYGGVLYALYRFSEKLGALDAVLALARHEPLLYRAFYDMVSGEGSYREIIWRSARPVLLAKIILAVAGHRFRGR